MILCPKCGKENLPTSKFCQKCGASLAPVLAPPVPTSPPPSPKQQVKVDQVSKGKPKVPQVLEFSWDGRIRSARELFRLLHDFLNKYSYKRKPKAPQVLEFSWDGRIRSARELFRLLHDFLNKYSYEHVYHELKDVPGAIEGTATFWDSLTGRKDYRKGNWWLLANGVILLVTSVIVFIKGITAISTTFEGAIAGILIFILGSILMKRCTTELRKSISLHVEGETYRARAEKRGETSSEVYDVVSNCRVVFSGKVGTPVPKVALRGQAGMSDSIAYGVAKLSKKISDWDSLKSEFDSLTADFQSLRPRIEIPAAVADNKKE